MKYKNVSEFPHEMEVCIANKSGECTAFIEMGTIKEGE
jgi:hypothetical protein